MERPDNHDLPGQRAPDLPVTARTFSTEELKAVIQRAVELQAVSSARTEDSLSEVDIVRIGQELGLDPATVRRAMAEVRGRPAEEQGALVRVVGAGTVRASRVLQRPAASTGLLMDRYLRESELMMPQRRFPDRTRYIRDSSLAAGFARFARGFSRSHHPLNLQQIDVAVSVLDADCCLLEVSVDLAGTRAGLVAGALGGGSVLTAGWVVTVWATASVDPLMLLGIPILAGAWYGMRATYSAIQKSTQEKLESLLDRVEHNELE